MSGAIKPSEADAVQSRTSNIHARDETLSGYGVSNRKIAVGMLPDREEPSEWDPSMDPLQELRSDCVRLGMTHDAVDGWAR